MPNLREEALLDLIEDVHASVTDRDLLTDVIGRISDMLEGAVVHYTRGVLLPHSVGESVQVGLPADAVEAWETHFHSVLPWMDLILRDKPDEFVEVRRHIRRADLEHTEMYNDWMRPLGLDPIGEFGSLHGGVNGRWGSGLAVYTRQASPAPDDEAVRALRVLDGHLATAARTWILLQQSSAERVALLDVLDQLSVAVLVLDERARIVAANAAARELLERREGIAAVRDELVGSVSSATKRLHEAVRLASSSGGRLVGSTELTFGLPRPGKEPLQATVAPVASELSNSQARRGSAVLFLDDPEREPRTSEDRLRRLYGFTPAEAQLAAALAAGRSVREHAEERERSVATVRTLLKRVYSKAGVSRQVDLVRLVRSQVIEAGGRD